MRWETRVSDSNPCKTRMLDMILYNMISKMNRKKKKKEREHNIKIVYTKLLEIFTRLNQFYLHMVGYK